MFRLGIIEECLEHRQRILDEFAPFLFSQKTENIPDDTEPLWHTNEYHVPDDKIEKLLTSLKTEVKLTWYVHAFSADKLFVVLKDKVFCISPFKDNTWNEMIKYGVEYAPVELRFLENIPLHI